MRISIVTISLNQARFLEQALLSVIGQDYPDIQYIVVDAGSTDGSRDIIEKYSRRLDKVIFEPDRGPADGLNKGFRVANGDVYGFLNSDDFLLPGAVSAAIEIFEERPDADVVSGHGVVVDEKNTAHHRIYSHRFGARMYAHHACVLVQPSTFFTQGAFWSVGGFNVENRVSWDAELWVDIALRRGRFLRANKFWSAFRLYEGSISGSGQYISESVRQHRRICQKIGVVAPPPFSDWIMHVTNRLTDPVVTSMRVRDALFFRESRCNATYSRS